MRAFLTRERKRTSSSSSLQADDKAAPAPTVPKVWQGRVNKRLEEIAVEQEHELLTTGDSEDSENSLLQANHLPGDDDDNDDTPRDNAMLVSNHSLPQSLNNHQQQAQRKQQGNADESSRLLLQSIGSDLDDSSNTNYFEEDSSFSSHYSAADNGILKSYHQPTSITNSMHQSLLETKLNHEGHESSRIDRKRQGEAVSNLNLATTTASFVSLERHRSSFNSHARVFQKILSASAMTILSLCFILQLLWLRSHWLVWLSTGLSFYCATLLWPNDESCWVDGRGNESQWQQARRRQELLAQGLPLKSRIMVAQAQAHRLQQRINILNQLKQQNDQFIRLKQEETMVMTMQVLLKSNKTPLMTHLNALTLSVLPAKLDAVHVKVNMQELLALAESKRGSRYVLFHLFRDMFAAKSTMFGYPLLLEKDDKKGKAPKHKKISSTKQKNQVHSSVDGGGSSSKRQAPPRLAEI